MAALGGCFLPVTHYGDHRVECECGWVYASAAWVTLESAVIGHRLNCAECGHTNAMHNYYSRCQGTLAQPDCSCLLTPDRV